MLEPEPGVLPSLSLLEGEEDHGHGILLLCVGHKQTVLAGESLADTGGFQNAALVGSFLAPGFQTAVGVWVPGGGGGRYLTLVTLVFDHA